MRLRQIALSALVSASITASLFCVNQLATAHACEPYDGSCGYQDPNPHTGGWSSPDLLWGSWYGPGWYGGRYWHGGPWYGW